MFLSKRLIFKGFTFFKVSSHIFSSFIMSFYAIIVNPSLSDILLPLHIEIHMGVCVQGYTDVCVTQNILQGFESISNFVK